ncbi:MAG: hypothetical protein HQL50_16025 [Magnetococcales bacterium]|nr:hypothetical protein [Magnetococcales bacterium]
MKTSSRSLQQRLLLRVGLMGITGLVLLILAIGSRIGESSRHLFEFQLHQQAAEVIRHLRLDAGESVHLVWTERLKERYDPSRRSGKYRFVVLDHHGEILLGSEEDPELFTPFEPFPGKGAHYFQAPSESPDTIFAGAALSFHIKGHAFYVQAVQNTAHTDVFIDLMLEEFFEDFGWVVILSFGLVLVAIHFTLRHELKPLVSIADKVSDLGPDNLDLRLDGTHLPGEIQPLVAAVNDALDRLETGYRRQREFTADVAHELRTPLTVLMSRLQMTLPPDQVEPLFADLENLIRLVNQLLKEAQLDTFILPGEARADLLEVCRETVAMLAPLAIGEGKELEVVGCAEALSVNGSHAALVQAVRNLVENGLRHTPVGETVSVELRETPQPQVRVIDRGSGVSESDQERLFDRFWRPVGDGGGGAGLGLSIVKRIMGHHGGEIAVRSRSGKGATFIMTFPALDDEGNAK